MYCSLYIVCSIAHRPLTRHIDQARVGEAGQSECAHEAHDGTLQEARIHRVKPSLHGDHLIVLFLKLSSQHFIFCLHVGLASFLLLPLVVHLPQEVARLLILDTEAV